MTIECMDCGKPALFEVGVSTCLSCGSQWREAQNDHSAISLSGFLAWVIIHLTCGATASYCLSAKSTRTRRWVKVVYGIHRLFIWKCSISPLCMGCPGGDQIKGVIDQPGSRPKKHEVALFHNLNPAQEHILPHGHF